MLSSLLRLLAGLLLVTLIGCAQVPGEATGSNAGASTDTTGVKTAISDLQTATDKKADTDARLGRALAAVGGVLTAKQQSAFVQAFNAQPDVAQVYGDYHTMATQLATELAKVTADAELTKTYGPTKVLAGYALLAKTTEGAAALQFGTDVLGGRIVLDGVTSDQITEQVMGPALAAAFLQNLIKEGKVPSAMTETINVLKSGNNWCMTIVGWLQRFNTFKDTDFSAITSTTTIESLRTIGGIIAIWQLGDDVFEGDPQKTITDFLNTGPAAVSGVTQGIAMYSRYIVGAQATPIADSVMMYAGKIATGIGIVMNALALLHDAGKWNDGLDAKMRVLSDVISIGACVAVLVSTGPVGPALALVAVGVSFFADWLQNRRLEAQEQKDLAACLPTTDLPAALVKTILASDPSIMKEMAEDAKLAPEDSQWMMTVDPNIANANSDGPPLQFVGLQVIEQIFKLDPQHTGEFLHASLGDDATTITTDSALKLDVLLHTLDAGEIRGDMTRDQVLDWFTTNGVVPLLSGRRAEVATPTLTAAHDYLASQP
jgi:hypothetical protein